MAEPLHSSGQLPPGEQWRLITASFFNGSIGGSGKVIGTSSWEQITVLDLPGAIEFDASFNRGNDCVVLPGEASRWMVRQQGSGAVFNDGDTTVTIPVGTNGMAVGFADGLRTLVYDAAAATMKIGAQAFDGSAATVTAPTDGTKLPPDTMGGSAKLFMAEGGVVSAGGRIDVFGTIGGEDVTLVSGHVALDASFNRGNDVVTLDRDIDGFEAWLNGSVVHFESTDLDVAIPVGTAGTAIRFRGGVEHTLAYDTGLGAVTLGSQHIALDPIALGAIA